MKSTRFQSNNRPLTQTGRVNAASEADPGAQDHINDPSQRRIALLLPEELLQSGETIILLRKPSHWYILLESLRFVIATIVVATFFAWIYNQGYYIYFDRHDLFLIAAITIGARVFWQFLEWLSRVYVMTDRRVIRVKGVVRVQVFETQLEQIQHTSTTFNLGERIFGLGSIHFATAGTATTEASWLMLDDPLEAHRIVVQTLNRYRR